MHELRDKIEEIRESQIRAEVTMEKIEQDLRYHIKRTNLLEAKVDKIDDRVLKVEQPVSFFTVVKLGGAVLATVGAAISIFLKLKG